MPFGEYENLADCKSKNSDKDDPTAYCMTIERSIREASMPSQLKIGFDIFTDYKTALDNLIKVKGFRVKTAAALLDKAIENQNKVTAVANLPELYEENGKRYAKFFLISSDWNARKWRVTKASVPEYMKTFEGMPYIDEPGKEHFGMTDETPVSEVLKKQEDYRAGNLEKVGYDPKTSVAYAVVEITKKSVWDELNRGEAIYVSPAVTGIANMDEFGRWTYDIWHGLHLARVKNPAYGVMAASIKETCEGPRSMCINRLFGNAVASGKVQSSSFNIVNSKAGYMPDCPEGEEMYNGKCIKKEMASLSKERDDLSTKVASLEKDKTDLESKIKNASAGGIDAETKKLIDTLQTKLASFEDGEKKKMADELAQAQVDAGLLKEADKPGIVTEFMKTDIGSLKAMYAVKKPLLDKIVSLNANGPGIKGSSTKLVHMPPSGEMTGQASIGGDKPITSVDDLEDLF